MSTSSLATLSFLTPSFAIAGAVLALVPVVIHILNRRRFRTIPWAAMGFLMEAMQTNRRRARLENWVLLTLRCLSVLFFGLALSRPLGCDSIAGGSLGRANGLYVIVVDNSLSMAYHAGRPENRTHLDQAKILIGQLIDHLNAGGESVVLITAAKPALGLIPTPTYDLQQAKGILNRVPQQYGCSDMAGALRLATEVGHAQERQPNKTLYIFSDDAACEWQGNDDTAIKSAGVELARLYRIHHFNMASSPQGNLAVVDLQPGGNFITTNACFSSDVIATLRSFGPLTKGMLQWKLDGQVVSGGGPLPFETNEEIRSQNSLGPALTSQTRDGAHVVTASVTDEDGLPQDNTRSRVMNVVSHLKTLIVQYQNGGSGQVGSGFNLKAALAGITQSGRTEGIVVPELISDLELSDHVLSNYQTVILCGIPQFRVPEVDQLQRFVSNGGTLMIFLGANVVAQSYNTMLLPRHLMPGPLTGRVIADGDKGFHFDFNPEGVLHPLLKAFAHQQQSGMETAQAFGYWQVDVPMDGQLRVLNWKPEASQSTTLKTGPPDPAITLHTLGQGRVVLVTTSADEEWITFTRKPIYTELFNELLSGSTNVGDAWMNLTVGNRLSVPSSVKLFAAPSLTDPASHPVPLDMETSASGPPTYRSHALDQPGVYTLATGGGSLPIAVNIPPGASDVHTIGDAALKSALGMVNLTMHDDRPIVEVERTNGSGDWSWPVMFILILLLGAESLIAMKVGRNSK